MKFFRKTIRTALRHGTENPRSVQILTKNIPECFHRTVGGREIVSIDRATGYHHHTGRYTGIWMRRRLRKWIITRPAASHKNFNPAK